MKPEYFHGGPAGRARFSFILPPSITKVKSTSDLVPNNVHRFDRVYLTPIQAGAMMYAAAFPNGVIYRCEPIGVIEDDLDCKVPEMSIACSRARVLSIIKPRQEEINAWRAVLLERNEA